MDSAGGRPRRRRVTLTEPMRATPIVALSLAANLLVGCTSLVAVKPSEVVKFSGALEQSATVATFGWGYGYPGRRGGFGMGPSYGTVTTVTLTNVETVDGRIESLPSLSDFDLVFRDGGVLHFEHPIDAHVDGDSLSIASRNRPREAYALASISHAEVTKLEPGKTTALVFGATFGVAALVFASPMILR